MEFLIGVILLQLKSDKYIRIKKNKDKYNLLNIFKTFLIRRQRNFNKLLFLLQ